MQIRRVIPVLLIHKGLLYKTKKFKDPRYVGDPTNSVRIFNEKEVDEIAIIDIDATVHGREPNYEQIREIAGEAFMPLAYGGGISKLDQIKKIIDQGVEKVILSHQAIKNPDIVSQTASQLGSSSTVVCLDYKKKFFGGYEVYTKNGTSSSGMDLVSLAKKYEDAGAGELIINSIDKDGMMEGYDLASIKAVTSAVSIPVIALGGAGNINDLTSAFENGATGAAAGSMFVFHGKHKAVLITYPEQSELDFIS
ncbi:MAG: imidazole glycerol phosphate synthase subunit HisF [Saprospiraceae bacterium]|nr:imidazole glycerol phosphate synthase subunit HisF [Saprospiraceae bacterium]